MTVRFWKAHIKSNSEQVPTDKAHTCMFTGHREISESREVLCERLTAELETLINAHGVHSFVAGGALGFDMLAEETVLKLKKRYPHIKLFLALPCVDQDKQWHADSQKRYRALLELADGVSFVQRDYTDGCMLRRNDYMISLSSYCICYKRRNAGGTAYTVKNAVSKGIKLINV